MPDFIPFLVGVLVGGVVCHLAARFYLLITDPIFSDRDRLDAVEQHGLSLHYADGKFGVMGGMPQRLVTPLCTDPRAALDYVLNIPELLEDTSFGTDYPPAA